MPNPPPVWDQNYPGGVLQQAADWNASQHSAIAQDPGTHAGPTGPTGMTGPVGIGASGPTGALGPTGSIPAVGSGKASFCAKLIADQAITNNIITVGFNRIVFQQGNYFNTSTHRWTPPAGVIFLSAQCSFSGDWSPNALVQIWIYKNGASIAFGQFQQPVSMSASVPISCIDVSSGSDFYEIVVEAYIKTIGSIYSGDQSFFYGTLLA